MPTTFETRPRGHQPAGPARWERARTWALEHPNSKQAKLYQARVDMADTVAATLPSRPWEIWATTWRGAGVEYRGQLCSTRCAILQLVLSAHQDTLEALEAYVKQDDPQWYLVERASDSKRRGKCLVCGDPVT
jgi:hypothetical protein